jgi:hypothetical protein
MSTITDEIPRDAWRRYFDDLSKRLVTVEATVEVDGRDLGAQIAVERLLLEGITYDDRDDALVIAFDVPGGDPDAYEHVIEAPQRIFVATGDSLDVTIDVEDAEQHKTIVRLEPPPALPGA